MKTPQDWLKTYYPIHADDPSLDTERKRIEHSLQKWRGLRPAVLTDHGLHMDQNCLEDEHGNRLLYISASSCSLCEAYACSDCPLPRKNPEYDCEGGLNSPWLRWTATYDPEPMIAALESLLLEGYKK